jgi:hypothetical protein
MGFVGGEWLLNSYIRVKMTPCYIDSVLWLSLYLKKWAR